MAQFLWLGSGLYPQNVHLWCVLCKDVHQVVPPLDLWILHHSQFGSGDRGYDICQQMRKPSWRDEIPLKPQMTLQSFDKWVIEFVGPITPLRNMGLCYIIIVTEYLTWWMEAQPVKDCIAATTTKFLFKNMLTWFGCPKILTSDHGTNFLNETISMLTKEFQIYHQQITLYHL